MSIAMIRLFTALIMFWIAAIAGCASVAPPATPSSKSVGEESERGPAYDSAMRLTLDRTVTSNDGTLRVRYACEPSPPPMNEPFAIEVSVEATNGAELRDVKVFADAGMPEHGHGMNVEPSVSAMGKNLFRVENMLFHMSGRWEVYFDVARDGLISRAQDEITLE